MTIQRASCIAQTPKKPLPSDHVARTLVGVVNHLDSLLRAVGRAGALVGGGGSVFVASEEETRVLSAGRRVSAAGG